jgi:iron complex transport system substrate-binding protein
MKKIILILTVSLFFTSRAFAQAPQEYHRVVSLLPSITEILFAIGAQDQVVGVTKFCKYPPEAQKKTIIGGLLDTNYEIIYRLKPDLVIVATEQGDQKEKLESMGFNIAEVETRSVQKIMESIGQLGKLLGHEQGAQKVVESIQNKIDTIKEKTKDLPKPKVMVTFLRPVGEKTIRDVYIAGTFTYFKDLLDLVGAVNAFQGTDMITSPILSAEGILRLDPDVIIEVMPTLKESKLTKQDALEDWVMLSQLKAYKNKRIYIISESYADIPGPRLVNMLDDMARYTHPEVDWSKP